MSRSFICLWISLVLLGPALAQHSGGPPPAWTWQSLETRLEDAAEDGFEGAVLVVRDGSVVLHKAYGLANREQHIPLRPDTVFAIGSAPIDFTRAGILLLADEGKLKLDDPITTFFQDVPIDKRNITVNDLMTGGSGLPDFHDLPTDDNKDHSWIDREEAVRRIFDQKLLFPPGSGQQHSHSAWVLLAAVIEIASGQSYPDFSRERLFQPAGLVDTGFFGEPVPQERVAVGYGLRKSSEPNSPPHWGPTSWLVMGSGGQVSTLSDMLRWEIAVRDGTVLPPEATRRYVRSSGGLSSDGDMFGFEFLHSHDPKSMFLLISNTIDSAEKRDQFRSLGQSLAMLTQAGAGIRRFSLGVVLAVTSEDAVIVQQLAPESAAEQAGVRAGDHLLTANGQPLGADPMGVLGPLLDQRSPIDLEVLRGNRRQTITVTPQPRPSE